MIRARDASSREVVSAFLARIDAINPKVNAIVTLVADRAMEAARAADERLARGESVGPLHGLPIAHKDLQATAGIRTTFGSPIFRDHVPDDDSPLVAQLKRAGAITIGKTNTPEFGAGSQTFNPVFGATLNPYDTTRTCGGSSGGAAVALACDMLPIADGTDMGGSLRNPAAFCGVVGMRPSSVGSRQSAVGSHQSSVGSRQSAVGSHQSSVGSHQSAVNGQSAWETLSVDGPLARSAEDVALLLSAITNTPVRDLARGFQGVRIAWAVDLPDVPFDRRIVATVDAARPAFASLGCIVEEAQPDLGAADRIFRTLRAKAFVEKHGDTVRAHRALVKETILEEIARGEKLTAGDVEAAERDRDELRKRVTEFMERYEFFVLPTTQVPPFAVDQPFVREINGVALESYIDWMKSCYYISAIGYPAISVPCGFTADGLPVGLQIVGRDRADWNVLQLAHAFEGVRGAIRKP